MYLDGESSWFFQQFDILKFKVDYLACMWTCLFDGFHSMLLPSLNNIAFMFWDLSVCLYLNFKHGDKTARLRRPVVIALIFEYISCPFYRHISEANKNMPDKISQGCASSCQNESVQLDFLKQKHFYTIKSICVPV